MTPGLPPSDYRHLEAAVAWLELGSHLEADAELDNITPQLRVHPDVLGVRWQVYAKAGKWSACGDLADAVIKLDPDRVAAWLDRGQRLTTCRRLAGCLRLPGVRPGSHGRQWDEGRGRSRVGSLDTLRL